MPNPIEPYLKELQPEIDREIEKVFPRKLTAKWLEKALGKADYAYDAKTLTDGMANPIWEFLDRGGKRWRPALTILCCEAVGGTKKQALPFTPLVELIHNGTLLSDDVEDNSAMRRGKPCTHLLYGVDVAVNDGAAMYFIPLSLLYNNPHKIKVATQEKIWHLYAQEMLRVSTGQAMDIWWHHGHKYDVTENEYLQMCAYKTGVLARFACRLGAFLGDATDKQADALGKFGETVGVAFQIQDDILNLVGEEFQKGKGVGEDIHEGKRTIMVLHALQKLSKIDRDRLLEILNSHPSDEETIREAIGLIEKAGSIAYARKKAKQLMEGAWKKLENVLPQTHAKKTLKAFAQYLIERNV